MRNERKIAAELSPMAARLFKRLCRHREQDIDVLFAVLWPAEKGFTKRERQQRLGAIISLANKKLGYYDLRILPGRARGTYQITYVLDRLIIKK